MPFCSQGVNSSARRSAKAEVRGANPRESANSKPLCLQQLQGEFRKLVFVGASPASSGNGVLESWGNGEVRSRRSPPNPTLHYSITPLFNGDHDVTAAHAPRRRLCPDSNRDWS